MTTSGPVRISAHAHAVLWTSAYVMLCATAIPAEAQMVDGTYTDDESYGAVIHDLIEGLFLAPALLAAFVATCLWLTHSRRAVEQLEPQFRHTRTRGWIWGSWFCPIVSAWFPYQVVRDIERATTRRTNPLTLWMWWLPFIGAMVTLRVPGPNRIADLVLVVLLAVGAAGWARIVLRIDRTQAERRLRPWAPLAKVPHEYYEA